MNKIYMRIGNTSFMRPYWDNAGYFASVVTHIEPSYSMDYEKEGGKEELKESIKELHNLVGNAETEGYEVVIGCGATQLIFAALDVLGRHNVYDKSPYW